MGSVKLDWTGQFHVVATTLCVLFGTQIGVPISLSGQDIWRVDPSPKLVLGVAFGSREQEFSRITKVRLVEPNAALLVADAGTGDIRLFGLNGDFIRSFGRQGSGPGEFRSIDQVFVRGDTIIASDSQNGRVVSWLLDGTLLANLSLTRILGERTWLLGIFRDGSVLVRSYRESEGYKGGVEDQYVNLIKVDLTSGSKTHLRKVFWDKMYRVVRERTTTGYPAPLAPGASVAVTSDWIWYSRGDDVILRRFTGNGDLTLSLPLPVAIAPTTAADVEAYVDQWTSPYSSATRSRLRAMISEMEVPEHLPTIVSLIPTSNRRIWACKFQRHEDSVRMCYVVTPDGHLSAKVQLPLNFEVFDASNGLVVGKRLDSAGVEQVVVYELLQN